MDNEEWGPWIEHDGKGCPIQAGQFVHVQAIACNGDFQEQVGRVAAFGDFVRAWDWSYYQRLSPFGFAYSKITRYRIRKPRGMAVLQELVANPPETPVMPEKVDA